MKKLLLTLCCGLSLNAFASETSSAIPSDTTNPVYINVNTGWASLHNLPTGSWVGSVNAGYNFNQALAIEIGDTLLPSSQFGATVTENVVDVAVKGTLPLSEMFSLYGRLGLGVGTNSWSGTVATTGSCILCTNGQSSTYGVGLAGVGASFKLSQHFDLRVEDYGLIPFQNTYTGAANVVIFGTQYNF